MEKTSLELRFQDLWHQGAAGIHAFRVSEGPTGPGIKAGTPLPPDWRAGDLTPHELKGPLAPFTLWIKQEYQRRSPEKRGPLRALAEAHSDLHPGLLAWLEDRKEDPLDEILRSKEELNFLREDRWKLLWELFSGGFSPDGPGFVLYNLQAADGDMLKFLTLGMESNLELPLIVLLSHRGENLFHHDLEEQKQFFSRLEKQKRVVLTPLPWAFSPPVPVQDQGTTQDYDLRRRFLCTREIRSAGGQKPPVLTLGDWAARAKWEIISDRLNDALVSLQRAMTLGQNRGEDTALVLELLAWVNFKKNNRSQAEKFLDRARGLVPGFTPAGLRDFSKTLKLLIQEGLWEAPGPREVFFQELQDLEKTPASPYPWIIRSTLTYYRTIAAVKGLEAAKKEALEAQALIQKQGNLFLTSKLYHILGYLHQTTQAPLALDFFDRGIELRKKLGSVDGLIRAYNGVGYFCFTLGDHDRALTYFQRSLELLETTEDFVEICLTVFNIALTYFVGGYFSFSLELLQRILAVMDHLSIPSLPWHSRQKLTFLAGLAAAHLDWNSLALEFWEGTPKDALPPDAMPGFHLLRSRLGPYLDLEIPPDEDLKQAYDLSRSFSHDVMAGHILIERLVAAWRENRGKDAQELQALAESLIPTSPLSAQRRLFEFVKAQKTLEGYQPPEPLNWQIRSISLNVVTLAKREASSFALSKSLGEMSFLKTFQERIHRDREEKSNLKLAKDLLMKEYPLEKIWFIEEAEAGPGVLFRYPARGPLPRWKDFWPQGDRPKNLSWAEAGKLWVATPFKAGAGRRVFSLACFQNRDNLVRREDLEVIQMAFRHLDVTLGLARAHQEITRRISTDLLTGVLNRGEFQRLAEIERRRCLRYHSQGQTRTFCVLYLDLDNFKAVNDTLGHPAGDEVLKIFAGVLKRSVRDLDLVGRIGGDEFLILLPETDLRGARVVAHRILEQIRSKSPFDPVVRGRSGSRLPEGKQVGTSVGGAEFNFVDQESLETLMERADQGLYQAKKAGKGVFATAQGVL